MGRNKSGPWSHSSATVAARCSRQALLRAHTIDAVTEEARKLDEDEEEDIFALCRVLIVLIVVGLANASLENIGRVGRIAGTAKVVRFRRSNLDLNLVATSTMPLSLLVAP